MSGWLIALACIAVVLATCLYLLATLVRNIACEVNRRGFHD